MYDSSLPRRPDRVGISQSLMPLASGTTKDEKVFLSRWERSEVRVLIGDTLTLT